MAPYLNLVTIILDTHKSHIESESQTIWNLNNKLSNYLHKIKFPKLNPMLKCMLNSLDQYCANHQSDRMNTNTEKTNAHVKWLLKSLTQNSNCDIMALILTEDNHRISVPLLLISMVWPDLMNIVQDLKNCCCSEIGISVPARKQTVLHFIEMLYTGTSSPLSLPESINVKKFCNLLGLNWIIISANVSYLLQTESKEK